MPRDGSEGRTRSDPPAAAREAREKRLFRLCRTSHIFASTVRERLEADILRSITPLPITRCQIHLLRLISTGGEHQPGKVAERLGLSAPAVTKNIDKLERFELVVRTPSAGDRRATLLSLSRKGSCLLEDFERAVERRLDPVLLDFEVCEIDATCQMMERLTLSLLDVAEARGDLCLRCAAYVDPFCPVGRARGGCPHPRSDAEPEGSGRRSGR